MNAPWFLFALIAVSSLLSFSAQARQVTLAWDANSEPILGGYRLYQGPTSGNYTSVTDVGNQTTFTVFGLEDHQPYYFAVTAYDTTKTIESAFSNEVSLSAISASAAQESPTEGSSESGIGLIRGWVCNAAKVEIEIDGAQRLATAHGTRRADTAATCVTADTGYGLTFNWNLLGDGPHRLRAFADGVEFANVGFRVTTLGQDFLTTAPEREYLLPDFPQANSNATVRWSTAHQNFVIVGSSVSRNATSQARPAPRRSMAAATLAHLESPTEGSSESGIGLIRGWVCNAAKVEIEIDGAQRLATAHGTRRADTAATCVTADTGYGLTFNWNLLGDGPHRLRAFADGVEFANVGFRVTTLGQEFLRDAPERAYTLPDFPRPGGNTVIRWSTAHQNFVIVGRDGS